MDDNKVSRIHHNYIPREISDKEIDYIIAHMWHQKENSKEAQLYKDLLHKMKYKNSIGAIRTDRNFIFAFLYSPEDIAIDFIQADIYPADVFDADTGEYLSTVHLPFVPSVIKGGCAYTIGKNIEGFYVLQKYRIDPAVYGK